MLKPQKLTTKQYLFIILASCCIISFFAAAVISSSPTIKLNGSEHVYLDIDEKYIERGAKAENSSGDSIPVGISGKVDSSLPGDTEIVYSASYLGRTVKTSRIVTVRDAQ